MFDTLKKNQYICTKGKLPALLSPIERKLLRTLTLPSSSTIIGLHWSRKQNPPSKKVSHRNSLGELTSVTASTKNKVVFSCQRPKTSLIRLA